MLLAVSEIAREVDRAMWLIGGTSLVMLFGITLAMVILVFKYRRSRTPKTTQIHGHKWLETVWIVIPTLIVFQNGEEKRRLVGARSKGQLQAELAEFIN